MNETTKRIKELRNEVDRINHEIFELERKNSNYYIGVYSVIIGMTTIVNLDLLLKNKQKLGLKINEMNSKMYIVQDISKLLRKFMKSLESGEVFINYKKASL